MSTMVRFHATHRPRRNRHASFPGGTSRRITHNPATTATSQRADKWPNERGIANQKPVSDALREACS